MPNVNFRGVTHVSLSPAAIKKNTKQNTLEPSIFQTSFTDYMGHSLRHTAGPKMMSFHSTLFCPNVRNLTLVYIN